MNIKEHFALTFMLEQYVNFPEKAYGFYIVGALNKNFISAALGLLFDESIFTPRGFYLEMKENFNVKIYPGQLKEYANGNFDTKKILMIRKEVKPNE